MYIFLFPVSPIHISYFKCLEFNTVTVICKEIYYETRYVILPFFCFLYIRSKKLYLSKCDNDGLSSVKNRTYFEYHITSPTFRNNLHSR